MDAELVITAVLLGAGLAMDAFSVSLANGLAEKDMSAGRTLAIAGTFAGFQFLMPLLGWILVRTAARQLRWFGALVPWIALVLLLYIGGKMLLEGARENKETEETEGPAGDLHPDPAGAGKEERSAETGPGELMMQGIATSIDALSVGFTIASYSLLQALSSSVIIGVVTLIICIAGLRIGRRLGTMLAGKASILGGVILIAIGLEIWIKGVIL